MFDLGTRQVSVNAHRVHAWVQQLASSGGPEDDRSRLDLISALEEL